MNKTEELFGYEEGLQISYAFSFSFAFNHGPVPPFALKRLNNLSQEAHYNLPFTKQEKDPSSSTKEKGSFQTGSLATWPLFMD